MNSAAHSKIGASSMHRWSECPGSVRLSSTVENRPSSYAEEGTAAHEVAASFLTTGKWPSNIDDEMLDAVKVYTDFITEQSEGKQRWIEQKFDLSEIYAGLFGTADAVIYDAKTKLLQVVDYKHGAGIAVEVENNVQLMYYGLGALLQAKVPCNEVELVIVQPRCPHPKSSIRKWRFASFDLLDFADDLANFAKKTEDPNALLVPGDHCRFCPAAGICPALHGKAVVLAKEEFKPEFSYDPQKLGAVLNWLPVFESWIKQVREFAYGEAQHGRNPAGWKLVQKRASRKWKGDEKMIALEIRKRFALPESLIMEKPSLKSVAQIEKLLAKNKQPEIKDLYVSESSGYTLALESDPREPAKLDAKSEFEVIEEKSVIDVGKMRDELDLLS